MGMLESWKLMNLLNSPVRAKDMAQRLSVHTPVMGPSWVSSPCWLDSSQAPVAEAPGGSMLLFSMSTYIAHTYTYLNIIFNKNYLGIALPGDPARPFPENTCMSF